MLLLSGDYDMKLSGRRVRSCSQPPMFAILLSQQRFRHFYQDPRYESFFKTTPHTLTWYDAFISSVAVALLVAAMGVLHPCVRTSRPCQLCFPSSKQEKVRVSEYFESWPSEFFSCNKCEFLFDAQLPCKSYFIYHIVIPRKQHILWSPSTYKFDPQQGFEEHDLVC